MNSRQKRLQMQLMHTGLYQQKLLASLYTLRNTVLDDPQDTTMIEEAIYAMDGISKLRMHLREKYKLSNIKEK